MSILKFIRDAIWADVPAEFSPRQRRWTAASWSTAAILLGLWIAFLRHRRGEPTGSLPWVVPATGVTLALLTLPPRFGSRFLMWVMRILSIFGFIVFNLALTAAFYLVVTPMGWMLRLAGKDPLQLRKTCRPHWTPHKPREGRNHYRRLF